MAEVINMGEFSAPRPNPLGQGLMEGAQSIQQGVNDRSQLTIETAKAKSQQKYQRNRLALELAKLDRQQENDDYNHTQTTLKQLGQLKDQDPGKFALLMQSEHGKEITKHIKKTVPEAIDENGEIIAPGVKDQALESLHNTEAQYINAVKSGKPVDPHLEQAYKAIKEHGPDDIATAVSNAMKNPASADPEQFKKMVTTQLQTLKELRQQNSSQSREQGGNQSPEQKPSDKVNSYADYLKTIQPGQ